MGPFNVRATPEPARDAMLVMRGPYRVLRHPMYSSLLLVALSLLLTHCTAVRLAAAVLLLFDLLVKLHCEERVLTARFTAYAECRTHTRCSIPFLY